MSSEDPYLQMFCSRCEAVMPLPGFSSVIVCKVCHKEMDANVYDGMEFSTTTEYNSYNPNDLSRSSKEAKDDNNMIPDGPIVERKCSSCGHELMSYTTLQLRSADEGQTVFFTCLKCRHKDIENS